MDQNHRNPSYPLEPPTKKARVSNNQSPITTFNEAGARVSLAYYDSGDQRSRSPLRQPGLAMERHFGGWGVAHEGVSRPVHESEWSRTLIVRNLPRRVCSDSVRHILERHGYICLFEDSIHINGTALITYFDIRAAIRTYKRTANLEIGGRRIDVDFHEEARMNATLEITLCNSKEAIDERQVQMLFQQYGEIRTVIRVPGIKAYAAIRRLEFFDTRDCIKAQKELHGHRLQGGTIEVEFVETTDVVKCKEERKQVGELKGTKRTYEQANEDMSVGPLPADTNLSISKLPPQPSYSSNGNNNDRVNQRLAEAQKLQRLLSALKPRNPMAPPTLGSQAMRPTPTPTPTSALALTPMESNPQLWNVSIPPAIQPATTRDPRLLRLQLTSMAPLR
ncbi:hypothetical protein VNI00_015484 [Paramarasmius palmivorus]|uniref:RRM domain-containing protein n=1 Tax=Paramarasmius palmivorus TaxID=297713 RepID=A0AAW0BK91_9AGAR